MKKYLMILVAVVGFGISANAADFCPVKNSKTGASVNSSVFFDGKNTVVQIVTNETKSVWVDYSVSGPCASNCSGSVLISSTKKATMNVVFGKDVSDKLTVNIASAECKQ